MIYPTLKISRREMEMWSVETLMPPWILLLPIELMGLSFFRCIFDPWSEIADFRCLIICILFNCDIWNWLRSNDPWPGICLVNIKCINAACRLDFDLFMFGVASHASQASTLSASHRKIRILTHVDCLGDGVEA